MEITFRPLYVRISNGVNINNLYELFDYIIGYGECKEEFIETYNDPLFKDLDCRIASRSTEDIYCILKTYFPKITLLDVFKVMKKYNDKNCNLCTYYCMHIFKNIWKIGANQKLGKSLFYYYTKESNYSYEYWFKPQNYDYLDILTQDEIMTIWENI